MSLAFTFHAAWQQELAESDARDIVDFWLREKALPNETAARRRLPQLIMFARARESGEVAGVCSADRRVPPHLGVPLYYYRTFIGRDWRRTRLVLYLLKRGSRELEKFARDNDFPCIGVLLELENTAFTRPGRNRRAVCWQPPYTYIGKSPRGLDQRVYYFRNAPLKFVE